MDAWHVAAWIALGLLVPAFASKPRKAARVPLAYHAANITASVLAGVWVALLAFAPWDVTWAAPAWLRTVGLLVAYIGVALAWWARRTLARRFATTARTPETVETGGPFAYMRHPFYAGCWLLLAGTALAVGSLLGLVIAAAQLPLLRALTDVEDQLLADLPGAMAWQDATPRFGLPRRRS